MGRLSPFPSLQALAHLLLVRPVLKVFFGASIVGKENLEGLEQFILVANHNSHLDTPLLFHILPPFVSSPGRILSALWTTSGRQRSFSGSPSSSSSPSGSSGEPKGRDP